MPALADEPICNCRYCQHIRGEPDRTRDRLIRLAEFCRRAGDRSHMWPRRRARDPRYRFPEIVKVGCVSCVWESDGMLYLDSPHAAMRTERQFREAAADEEKGAA